VNSLPGEEEDVVAKARRLTQQGLYQEEGHAYHQTRERNLTQHDIRYVLTKTGKHIPEKDEYCEEREAVKHVIEGTNVDGERLRVVIYFKKEEPVPEEFVCVITAFWR